MSSRINRTAVLGLIHRRPLVSRSEIARATGLDPSTVTHILRGLLKDKLVEETMIGEPHKKVGRKPVFLRVRYETRCLTAVEIGTDEVIIGH